MKINKAHNPFRLFILLPCLVHGLWLSAQDPSEELVADIPLELIEEIPLDAERFIGADEKGGIYYIRDQVFYREVSGKTFTFSSPEYGDLSQVVIYNPFKILLFYKDFNTVVLLDNNLNPLSSPIDLTPESRLYNVTHVGISSQNNIWLFADDNKLHLLNYQNRSEVLETQPLTFYDEDFKLLGLYATFKMVWLLTDNAIYAFNEYGNFLEQEETVGVEQLFPLARNQGRLTGDAFYLHSDTGSRAFDLELPEKPFEVYLTASMLYLYKDGRLSRYKFGL